MYLRVDRICACMMWFVVWQLNGAKSQLTVEVRNYTSSTRTAYTTVRMYTDPNRTASLSDWFTDRFVNIPEAFNGSNFQLNGGITGSLYYPNPRNACSQVSKPPASNNSDTVWLAIVSGYPNCTSVKIRLLNFRGYRAMITYSVGDTNRVPPSDTRFPVAIVTEEFANYLIQNAAVTSADSLTTVHVSRNRLRRGWILFFIVVAFLLAAGCVIGTFWSFCNFFNELKSRNRNATRQQEQLRPRSQECHERDEQQNSRPGRCETIQLRELQRNVQQEERQEQQSPGNVTDREGTAQQQEHGHQQPAQQQQRTRHVRLQNTVPANVSERARQTLPETRQHHEAMQHRRQGEDGRRRSDIQQRRFQNTAEPLYTNVRTTFRGRQFNIQTESCKACHICRVDFNDGETVQVLPCNPDHIFHAACVQPYITIHRKYPVCRENVTDRTMQRSAGINQQLAEPLQYGSFWCRQFSNIQTESCKTCTICLVDFNDGETVRILPCDSDHIFHAACVQPWITMHGQCPVCRENIVHTS